LGRGQSLKIFKKNPAQVGLHCYSSFFFLETHCHNYNKLSLCCHPFGQEEDAFKRLKSLKIHRDACNELEICFVDTDTSTDFLNKEHCDNYIHDNFPNDTESKVFPQIIQDENKSLSLPAKLKSIFDGERCFILHKVNFYKHLQTFGFEKKEIGTNICSNLSNEDEVIVVYPPDCRTAVIITLQESRQTSLHKLHLKCNGNVRAFIELHKQFFDRNRVLQIVGIVGAIHFSRDEIKNISYCKECPSKAIMSADDIESKESIKQWWRDMENEFKKRKRNIPKFKINDNAEWIDGFAGLLVIAEASKDDQFSKYDAEVDEIIKKMIILNQSQLKVFENPEKHKIIKGTYCYIA